MIVAIIDPMFKRKGGHFYDWNILIGRALRLKGHTVKYFVANDLLISSDDELFGIGEVHKVFSSVNQGRVLLKKSNGTLTLSDLHLLRSFQIAEGLANVQGVDLCFWPSCWHPSDMMACSLLQDLPPMCFSLHQDPGISRSSALSKIWKSAILEMVRNHKNIHFCSVENEITHRFIELAGVPISNLPYPVDLRFDAVRRKLPITCGIFGAQRDEKGLNLVTPLVTSLLGLGFNVIYHDSHERQIFGEQRNLRVVGFVDDLSLAIKDCDFVILPYSKDTYALQGSGILSYCIASATPVVCPAATLPGRTVTSNRIGSVFTAYNQASIIESVLDIVINFDQVSQESFDYAKVWNGRNGSLRLVEFLEEFYIKSL